MVRLILAICVSGCGETALEFPSIERAGSPRPVLERFPYAPPTDARIADYCNGDGRNETVGCLVGAINSSLGCDQLTQDESRPLELINQGTGKRITVHFYSAADWPYGDHKSGEEVDDNAFEASVYVLDDAPGLQDKASILLHEIGHALELRYPDNTPDKRHSSVRGSAMFYVSPFVVEETSLRSFVADLYAQKLVCN